MFASNYFEEKILNLMRGQSIVAPEKVYLALFFDNPQDDASGTEVVYTGYARQEIILSAPAASGGGIITQNVDDITFAECLISVGNVGYVALMDNINSGHVLLYAQLATPLNIQPGVAPVFRAGDVNWLMTGNLSTYYKNAIINTLRGTNLPGFTPYLGLCNGDPTGAGNEFTGNNYARTLLTMNSPEQQSSGAALSDNTTQVISPVASGTWGTLNTVAVFDSQVSGNAYAVIPLGSSFTVNPSYSVGLHIGSLQINVN